MKYQLFTSPAQIPVSLPRFYLINQIFEVLTKF